MAIVPGFLSITRKTSLVRSLRSMYGDDAAFTIVPRTFKLPDEMDEWEAWINAHPKVWRSAHARRLGENALGKCWWMHHPSPGWMHYPSPGWMG